VSAPLVVNGCVAGSPTAVAKPLASLSVRFGPSGDGVMTGHFKAGRGLPPLTRAQLKLPPGLKAGRRGLKVSEARVLGRRSLLLRGRTLDARLGKKGTKRVSLRWRGIKASRKIAALLPRRPRITFVIVFTDTSGRSTKVPVVVRPSISHR
jgi:hypothetical protein